MQKSDIINYTALLFKNINRFSCITKYVHDNYEIEPDDGLIIVDTTNGDVTLTLPPAYSIRKGIIIRRLYNLNILNVISDDTIYFLKKDSIVQSNEIEVLTGEEINLISDGEDSYYIGGTYGTTEALDNFPGIEFFWSDDANKIIYHASEGEYALTIRVKVIQEFTGLAALSIVYGNDNTELVPADAIDLTAVGEYEYYPSQKFTAATDIKLNLNIDTSLQGSGIIFITRTTNIL